MGERRTSPKVVIVASLVRNTTATGAISDQQSAEQLLTADR
jgi:hypothetical protein